MRRAIAVIGSAKSETGFDIKALTRRIGDQIAVRECLLYTGGTGGLPYEAALAAQGRSGMTVGVSPAKTLREHIENGWPHGAYVGLILTGRPPEERREILINSAQAVVAISGGEGTADELNIAYRAEKTIGLLAGTGGAVDHFDKQGEFILRESDPRRLVDAIIDKR